MRFAALGTFAGLPALVAAQQGTQTTLSAETHDLNGRTRAALSVSVTGEDGQPVSGPVVIEDGQKQVTGAALDEQGKAAITVDLLAGTHTLKAVYVGDSGHKASSAAAAVSAQASSTPDFGITVNPASLTLSQGQSGTVTAIVTPVNASALTAPMFVTLSCGGTPDQTSCSFTPENVEIVPGATANINSTMVVTTVKGTGQSIASAMRHRNDVTLAVLLPGFLALTGMGFAARRRWLSRLSLIALVGVVTVLGTTACSPLYNYYNHGPPHNLPTPAGTYTLTITAQTSNGITAASHTATLGLTVQTVK